MYINKKRINKLNENDFNKVLNNYKFQSKDASMLKSIQDITISNKDLLMDGFYKFIFEFSHAKVFLHNKDIIKKHRKGIVLWFSNLFCGKYDEEYFNKLSLISEIHVRIGLPAHYVNAAFSYIRGFTKDILIKEKRYEALSSLDKIIDINLDILTIAYREEEQTKLTSEILFLNKVVEQKNILPYFQPIINAKTLKIEKYESLMRLYNEETCDVVSIFPYLEIVKKIKLYEKMMDLMINKTFKVLCQNDFEFSINLSYEDIENDVFRNKIYNKIKSCSNPSRIIFEILESDCIKDFSIVQEFVLTVRKYKCKIAIDDFGSGYSSMENILKLKPEIIKIDASLIKNIDTSLESKTIVKNTVIMAKELNAKTIAEYVHSREVFEIVRDLDVDYLQGFYLGEPKEII